MNSDDWDAESTSFFESGVPFTKFKVRHGLKNGLSKYYNSKGVLVKEYYLVDDSIKNGEYREFYDNGQISLDAIYKKDTLTGTEYFFNKNGDTLKYFKLRNGGQSMPYKRWLDNGNILEGDFIDTSEKAVIWRWFDKDGKEIKRKIQYPINKIFVSPEPN